MIEQSKLFLLSSLMEEQGYLPKSLKLFKLEFYDVYSDDCELLASVPVYYSESFSSLELFGKSICLFYSTAFLKKVIRFTISSFELKTSISTPNLELLLENEEKYLTELDLKAIISVDSRFIKSI
jgi:hypothetical protein